MEDYKDMLVKTYDATVKEYVEHEFNNKTMEKHFQKFLELIPKKASILDVGCGPGQATKRFASQGHDLTGLDLSEKMIEHARKEVPNAKFLVKDIEEFETEEKFDGIWAAFVLIHLPREKHPQAIEKFYEMLKPGGILYLGMIEGQGEKLMQEPYNRKYKQWFVFVTKKEIESLLEKEFELIEYSVEKYDEEGDLFALSSTFARKKVITD